MQSKILLCKQRKKHFQVKSASFVWIEFRSILSILQKLKLANNLKTILDYGNDKYIYIGKNIILID